MGGGKGEDEGLLSSPEYNRESSFREFKDDPDSAKRKGAPANRWNEGTVKYATRVALHILTCFAVAAYLFACSSYLLFKINLYSRNFREVQAAPWLLVVLILELIYFCGSLIAAVDNVLPPANRRRLELDGVHFPTVDILLPCCKEPIEVPAESILAALKLDYPSDRLRVLVLDDGGDDDLKVLSQTLQVDTGGQVVYLRRTKVAGVAHHFKCGNLNYGLEHSNSDYVVMMDADMILHPSFLRRTLPYIVKSPNVAFVQVPQSFYNLPLGDPLGDSSILGYDRVLVHRDSLGFATCIGTGALFSRRHLNAIGGFQPQSITEDTTTAYTLFKEGYQSVYLNEKLQIGLTPWTFDGYIKQRCRWGQGAMQQFKSTWKEMLGKDSKLNFVLKVIYFWHSGYYFLSIVNVLLVGTLFSALLFRLRLAVGAEEENRELIASLAYNLIFWRVYWTCLFLAVPLPVQSRNREESHFWWITPFFVKMIMESLFAYDSTFEFVPTSNIDRNAAKRKENKHGQLKHVRFHIAYALIVLSVVTGRVYITIKENGLHNCRESFFVIGISFFLMVTCAHVMLPVLYIIWPTNFKPSDRKSLLKYDADGAPIFNPLEDCVPKWYWSVLFYEAISCATLAFWGIVLWAVKSGNDKKWCKESAV